MRAGLLLKFNHDDRPLRVKGTTLRSSHGGFRFNERNWFGHIVFQKDQVRGMTSILSPSLSPSRKGREANQGEESEFCSRLELSKLPESC
jgi:hypothetical protein